MSLTYEPGRAALSARAEVVEELRPLAQRGARAAGARRALRAAARGPVPASARAGAVRTAPGARWSRARRWRCSKRAASWPRPSWWAAAGARAAAGGRARRGDRGRGPLARGQRRADRAGIQAATASPSQLERRRTLLSRHRAGPGAPGPGPLRAARARRARAEDLLDYLRAPGRSRSPRRPTGSKPRCAGGGCAPPGRRPRWPRVELGELDVLRAAEDPGAELARQARRLLAAPYRGRAPVLGAAEELDARAVAALGRALRELGEVDATPAGRELIELLETLELPAGPPPAAGAVLVSDPLSIRARRFRAVLVFGLQENEFPLPPRPSRSCPTSCAASWRACSGLRLRPREDALARERYLFYTSVSRATERVILSYRSSDEEGNLALPSPFLDDVAELLAEDWPERRRRRMLADVVWRRLPRRPSASWPAPSRGAGAGGGRGALADRLAGRGGAGPRAPQPDPLGRRSGDLRRLPGEVAGRPRAPARGALEPDSDALARGSYMHAVLERVLRRLGEPVTPESLPRALELLDEVLGEQAQGSPPAAARPCGRGGPGRWPPTCGATWPTRRATDPRGRSAASSCGSDSISRTSRTRCRPSSWATRCACAGSSTGSTSTARAGPSCATTRADRPAPSTRARAGRPTASSRWRCT